VIVAECKDPAVANINMATNIGSECLIWVWGLGYFLVDSTR
jgi:hypothetical protein